MHASTTRPPFGVLSLNELMLTDVRDYSLNLATSNKGGEVETSSPFFYEENAPTTYCSRGASLSLLVPVFPVLLTGQASAIRRAKSYLSAVTQYSGDLGVAVFEVLGDVFGWLADSNCWIEIAVVLI